MTDVELAALLRESLPEELSPQQLGLLGRRIQDSAELRAALAEELELEQTLCGALGEVHISLDWIFSQAATASAAGGLAKLFGWGSTTALIVAVTSVGVLIQRPWAGNPRPADQPVQAVAVNRPAAPRVEEPLAPAEAEIDELAPPAPQIEEPEVASPSDAIIPIQPAKPRHGKPTDREAEARPERPTPGPVVRPATENAGLFVELPGADFDRLDARLEALEGAHQPVLKEGVRQPGIALGGLAKLNEPWSAGTALRVRFGDGRRLQFHLWNGSQGITLERYEQPQAGWAVYRTTRRARDWRPLTRRLIATDGDRYVRCGQGTVDLRLQDEQLLLVRGDVPLLSIPCPAAPEAVVLEGSAALVDLSLAPCRPLACEAPASKNALDAAAPNQLNWIRDLPSGAEWTFLAEGRGELLAEDTSAPAKVFLPIPDLGLREITFELEDPLPGAGVFLGDSAGRPLVQVGFFSDETTGQTSFGWLLPGEMRTTARVELGRGPATLSDLRPWLRLVLAGSAAHCFVSGDGVHWSPVLEPLPVLQGGLSTAGLYALPGGGARCIRLRRIEARPLAAMEALADSALRLQVSGLDSATDFAGWQRAVAGSLPPGADYEAWRRGCAVELLAAAARPDLASDVLLDLLDSVMTDETLSPQQRIGLLSEAASIYDASSFGAAEAFVKQYERLGLALLRESKTPPYSAIRMALMTSPLRTSQPIHVLPTSLLRSELAMFAEGDDEESLNALCRQLRFFAGQTDETDGAPGNVGRQEVLRLIAEHASPADPQ